LFATIARDDAQRYSFGVSKLSSDEARRIGQGDRAHPRIHDAAPGLLFPRWRTAWRADRPTTSLLEDRYIR